MPKLSVDNKNVVIALRRKGQTKFIVKGTPSRPNGLKGRVVLHDDGEIAASSEHQFVFNGVSAKSSNWGPSYKCVRNPTSREMECIMDNLFGLYELNSTDK